MIRSGDFASCQCCREFRRPGVAWWSIRSWRGTIPSLPAECVHMFDPCIDEVPGADVVAHPQSFSSGVGERLLDDFLCGVDGIGDPDDGERPRRGGINSVVTLVDARIEQGRFGTLTTVHSHRII